MNAQVFVLVVVAAVTILLTATVFGLVAIIRKSISPFIRILAATAVALSLLLSPGVVGTAVMQSKSSDVITYTSIDPGWLFKLVPAVIAIVVAALLVVGAGRRAAPRIR